MIRYLIPAAALACLLSQAAPSLAQTDPYTWNSTINGNWSLDTNWLDGTATPFVPPSADTTQLIFSASGTTSYTATNDIGPFTLNKLTVNNTGTGTITITGASTANTLTFAGTNPTLDIQAGNVVFLGLMEGSETITKTGNGTFIHDSNNAGFTGTLVIDGGSFINRATTVATTNFNPVSIVVNNTGTYQFGAATVGNPNLPNSTFVTVNTGGTVIWDEAEDFGGIHLNGGTLNLRRGGYNAQGSSAQNWTSGMVTGGTFAIAGTGASSVINKTTAGIVTITGGASITGTGPVNIQEGAITHVNAANLGSSAITLGTASTTGTFEYQGITAARGGTFTINDGGGVINVTNPAATLTLSGAFSGAGSLTKSGAGGLNITGAFGIAGTTTINGGALRVNPITASGGFVMMDGTTLAINSGAGTVSFTTPTLSLGPTASTLSFELNAAVVPTIPLIVVSNADGLTGSGVTVRLTNIQPLASGTYMLIDYTGAAITSGYSASLLGRSTGTIVYNTANTSIDLNVSAEPVKWGGQISNVWDVGTSPGVDGTFNWRLGSSGSPTNFVNSDAIVFDDSADLFSVDLGSAVSPSSVSVNNSTNAYTIGGTGKITGSAGLVKSGTGVLTLMTNNDYTGPTILTAGSIQLGNGGTTGSITSPISGTGGTVIFNRSDNLTFASTLTGAVGITKNNTNIVTLTGVNTQTGTVTINTGIISIATQNNLGGNTPVTFNGGTLRITGTYSTGANIQVFTFGGAGGTIEVTGSATKQGNSITGPGNLNKTGAGLLSIGSAGGTGFTGTLNVLAGTLRFQSQRLSNANGINVSAGAVHELNDDAVAGTFFIATGSSVVLNGAGPSGSTTPGAFILTDQGGGTTGPTTTYRNAIVLATNSTIGTHNGGGTRVSTLIFENSFTGPGSLTKVGAGVLVLTAAGSTYGGANGTTTIANGAIQIRNGDDRLPTATSLILGTGTTSGQFDLNSLNQTIADLSTLGTGTQNAVVNTGATVSTLTVDYNGAAPQIYSGFLGGGALGFNGFNLVKAGTGTFTIGQAATYSGSTTIASGILQIGGNNFLPSAPLILGGGSNSGTLELNGFGQTIGGLTTAGTGTANQVINTSATAASLTINYSSATPQTYAGRLGGASGNNFSLNKTGSGTVILTGPLSLTGTTTISEGTLKFAQSALSSALTVADSATLGVLVSAVPSTLSMPTLTLGTGGSFLTFDFASSALPTAPLINVTTLDGFIPGSGFHTINLISNGLLPSGTFTLINYNNSVAITDGFTIDTSTLPARTVANITYNTVNTSIDAVVSVDTIKWNGNVSADWDTGSSAGVGGTFNWKLTSSSVPTNFVQTDVVTFDDTAAGNFNVNLTNSAIQPTSITVNNSTNAYTFSTTTDGAITGPTTLAKLGSNTLTILTENTYTGQTTVTAGTLRIGNGGTTGAIGTGNLVNNASVIFDRSDDVIFGGNISGSGSFTKSGPNSLTLTGTYTPSGNTTISDGFLILETETNYTYGGNIGGLGGLTKSGSATVTLTGASNYAGLTSITSGVLQLGDGGSTGSIAGNLSIDVGTLLVFNRSIATSFTGTITGNGGVSQIGAGETTIVGDAAFAGPITVNTGKLTLNRLSPVGQSGPTTVSSGANLEVNVGATGSLTVSGLTTIATGGSMKINVAAGGSLSMQALGGQMAINGTYEINAGTGSNIAYSSIISGSGEIIKSGDGQANFFNANTFNGTLTINAGILRIEDNGLGGNMNAVSIVVNSGGKFEFFGPNGNPDMPNATYITINTGGIAEFTENEDFGGIKLFGGALNLSDVPGNLGFQGAADSEFRSGTVNLIGTASTIAGAGTIRKTTSGTVAVTGVPINVTGGLFLDDGIFSTDSTIGGASGLITFGTDGGSPTSGTLHYTGPTVANSKAITLNAGGGTVEVSTAATVFTLNGAIGGTGSLTKTGTGILELNGASNYSGGTTVSAGILAANNATGSATGSGTVSVNNGGTLRGGDAAGTTGFISGPVNVNTGGKIRGGNSIGTLTVNNNVTIGQNGILETEVTLLSPGVAGSSIVKLTGAPGVLNLNPGAGNTFTINLVNDTVNPLVDGESYLITLAQVETAGNIQLNGSSLAGNTVIAAGNYNLTYQNFSGFAGTTTLTLMTDSTGTMLQLSVAAVPEPKHIMLIGFGVLGMLGLLARRLRKSPIVIA